MKKTYYFSHDYGARKDPKLVKLMMTEGHSGKGIYWDIIEMMYEEGGYLLLSEIATYAFELRTECDRIANVLHSYDLFKNDGEKVWSESVLRRLKLREEKSTKAAESAAKRWKNNAENKQVNANALRTHCDGNAIKERKGKESKVNENKDSDKDDQSLTTLPTQPKKNNGKSLKETFETREREFKESLFPFVGTYEKDLVKAFFEYWSEPDKIGKMRFEKEKTWETGRRLAKWKQNDEKFKSERKTTSGLNTPDGLMNIDIDY